MVSIERYRERKKAALMAIAARQGLPNIQCQDCGVEWQGFDGDVEIHVDHINEEDGHPDVSGGMAHLYMIEDDVANNIPMTLRCKSCHEERHDRKLFNPEPEVNILE